MGKRSLGGTWNSLNQGQREEFVKGFCSLLKASQARSLLMFTKGKVTYQPQILKAEYAEVPLVIMPPNDKITASFRMFKKAQGWMIYDLVIEGVSSLGHYKAQFARIIQESSFKNLLKVLMAKI
jgi:phospholipid transport system substrate-binding protein